MEKEQPIDTVVDLNLECYDQLGDCFCPFEVSSNGYATSVSFCGYPIWGTEDQGDRVYDEDKDEYEPLAGYLRREARRLLVNLEAQARYWDKLVGEEVPRRE